MLLTYSRLMKEVRRRHDVVHRVLRNEVTADPRSLEEFCYVHLRMICELIAIGCLILHGDVKETKNGKFTNAYQADVIVKMLGKLHEDFYPKPGNKVLSNGFLNHVDIHVDCLTQNDLAKLYHKAGEILHIGNIKKLPVNWTRTPDFDAINIWMGKVLALLSSHRIVLIDRQNEVWVEMNSAIDGEVHVDLMTRIGGSPPFADAN